MTSKDEYVMWAAEQEYLPIFMQPWWMDAVCAGKEWDVLLVKKKDIYPLERSADTEDKIVAAMPYLFRKKWFMKYIVMPQETQIGGIYASEPQEGESLEFIAERNAKITTFLVEKLAQMKLWYYYQQFPIGSPFPNLLKKQGFCVKERVTYRLDDLADLEGVIDNFSKNKKRQLVKASSLHVETGLNGEGFYRFHTHCMLLRKRKLSYSREFLLVLERKTSRLKQSQILAIKDENGELHAAAYLVWDKHTMYYLLPCYSSEHKDSGASALLVLEAIKIARANGVSFDFEGSMESGIANHYKQFGSIPNKYYSVHRYYHKFFWLAMAYNRLRNIRYGI